MNIANASHPPLPDSIAYYNENARHYFDTTVDFDLGLLYALFLPHLKKGAKILDAGCGSGRDSKYFLNQGYKVEAFDGSEKLVELARQFTGLPVEHKRMNEVNNRAEFDGIWANASLLHVPKDELFPVLRQLKEALKPEGVWYMSFRYGEGEHDEGDRYFYDQTESSLTVLLNRLGGVKILHMTVPENLTSRRGYRFVSSVVQKITP